MDTLPASFDLKPDPSIQSLEIRTEVLDPITNTDSECVFQVPMNGILDGGSFVQLAVSADDSHFFPMMTGIHSLIDSCELQVGTKVVMSNQKYAHRQTLVRQLDSPEHRAYVDMVKTGATGDRWAQKDVAKAINFRDLTYNANQTTATIPEFIRPTAVASTTPVFAVQLSQLFPAMLLRTLPLFAMKEQVYIRLRWNKQTSVAQLGTITCQTFGSGASKVATPSLSNIKFVSDHLYYSDDTMNARAQQIASQSGEAFLYEDLILTESQTPASSAVGAGQVVEQRVEREVAVSGRNVRSLLLADQYTTLTDEKSQAVALFGKYIASEGRVPDELNFRVNDSRVFDRNLVAPTRKWNELRFAMGRPLRVPSILYSQDNDTNKGVASRPLTQSTIASVAVQGYNTTAGHLNATQHYSGLDLSTTGVNALGAGTQIGVKPIQITKTYHRTTGENQARTLRVWANVERTMTIKNGEVMVSA
tara:strand:- start:2406 stop:3833 length:1428 start_codon:yes stop_codon:yes gene_type:complete